MTTMDGDFIPGMVAMTISGIDFRSKERCHSARNVQTEAPGLLSLKPSSSSSNSQWNKQNYPSGNVKCFSINEIARTGLIQNEANERSKYVNSLKRYSEQGKTVSKKTRNCHSLPINITSTSNVEAQHSSSRVENVLDCSKSKKSESRIKNKKSAKKRKCIVNTNVSMFDAGSANSNKSIIDVMKSESKVFLQQSHNGNMQNLNTGHIETRKKIKKSAKKIKLDVNMNASVCNEGGPKSNEFNVDFDLKTGSKMSFSMKKMKQSIKNIERASQENRRKHNSQNEYRYSTSKIINKNNTPKVIEGCDNGGIAPNLDVKGTKSCLIDNDWIGLKQKTSELKALKQTNESLDMRTIFVGNLSKKLNRRKVKRLFSQYGKVECVRFRCPPLADPRVPKKVAVIKQDYHANRSNITAYVRFTSVEDAKKALVANGTVVCEHHIRVDMATADPNHDYKKAIFIGNLSYAVEEEELWKVFEMCGPIESIRVVRDQVANIGRGYAYVNFKSADAVELALNMEGQLVGDREMRIKRSTHIKKGTKTIKRARSNLYKRMLQADSRKQTSVAKVTELKGDAKQKNTDTSHSFEGKKTAEGKSLKPETKNNKTRKKKSRSILKKAKLIQILAKK